MMSIWYSLLDWLPFDMFHYDFMKNALLAILLLAPLLGLAGTMVVNNRLSYYSDALGHSALAGIALGTIIGVGDLLLSLVLFGIVFGIALTTVKNKAKASTDTIIGVFSASAVALGVALLSRAGGFARYSNFLVGDILAIRPTDILILLLALIACLTFWVLFFNPLLLTSVNASLARSKRIRVRLLEYAFMILIAILVTLSIKWVGTLLINALIILPAAAARNLASNVRSYQRLTILFSVLASLTGLLLSFHFDMAAGATIVLCCSVIFILTWLVSQLRPARS